MKTIFEKGLPGSKSYSLPKEAKGWEQITPLEHLCRKEPIALPEVSEVTITRHFSELSHKNIGIDNCFYPLGSCTMKLNPRVNEWAASLPEFQSLHPLAPDHLVQGALEICDEFSKFLADLTGMKGASLNPNAGAQGEMVGIKMIRAYHEKNGDYQRDEMLIPNSAHGTNPATAKMVGYRVREVKSTETGDIDLDHLQELLSERTAGLMLTNPNTLGIFSPNILRICEAVHSVGGLMFYDGANLNAILELVRPGQMGFDVMHINLHKTFSTPHGGGGPGSGPICCSERLCPFLPLPFVEKTEQGYRTVWNAENSMGQIASFRGNFGIYLRAYLYAILHGRYGLRKVAESAVLHANYLKKKIAKFLHVPFSTFCMHEFVCQADRFVDRGVKAIDLAKRMLDFGIYAPTVYFPLIVRECLLIEPTEVESKDTLDAFIAIVEAICQEAEEDPLLVQTAPHSTPVGRLDEVQASRTPVLCSLSNTH